MIWGWDRILFVVIVIIVFDAAGYAGVLPDGHLALFVIVCRGVGSVPFHRRYRADGRGGRRMTAR